MTTAIRLATLGLALATLASGHSEVSYGLLHRWGELGTDPGQMTRPHGITVDNQGNLLVTDRISSRVQRFTPAGEFLGEIGKGPGKAPGHFRAPSDVKLDAKGNIFVADGDNHRVQVFTAGGEFIRTFGRKGTKAGELQSPHALVIGKDQRIYVAEDDNHRVSVFDHGGQFQVFWNDRHDKIRAWYKPHGMGLDPNGDIFVCNFYLPCYKLTAEGQLLTVFAAPRADPGPFIIHGLATDQSGSVYATTRDRSQKDSILKFNNEGTIIGSWSPPDESKGLECIAADKAGRIYVTVGKVNPGVEVYGQHP